MESGKRYFFFNTNGEPETIEVDNTRNAHVEYRHVDGAIKGRGRVRTDTFKQLLQSGYFKEEKV